MNQSLWQKLKRVKLLDLCHIALFLIAIPIALIYRMRHRNIWLFCDLPGEARDNGYWLFRYVREKHPELDAIFAINSTSPDYMKVAVFGKTVPFGSYRHWILYLSAKHVISSQKASGPNASVCYVLERFRLFRGNKIFLQHGIIKDNISFLYYKYTNIRLFTCSTEAEFQYVKEHYGYPNGHVQLLGLCRFDELLKPSCTENTLLIIPTWRKWLSHPTEGTHKQDLENGFLNSSFYQNWNGLLNSDTFSQMLEYHNWNAVFYLHREMQKYSKHLQSSSSRIRIGTFPEFEVQSLLKQSKLLVTDYSSVAMDFALLNKPLCYYQFDYEDFRKRHLEEGYFNYIDDGFGPVCKNEQELLNTISKYISETFSEDSIYQYRRDMFFTLRDCNNCKRTYEAIVKID